ncbi:hypothetical protein KY348_03195 [Candidatus Woesearchaeota archaeon]|nr:hypothetical protein [Candidatus Woesearchaeota archaeon]
MTHKITFGLSLILIVAVTAVAAIITVTGVANGNSNFVKYASGNAATVESMPPPVGGHPSKEITIYKITFGGRVGIDSKRGFDGNWRIRFRDVSQNELDNSMFRLASIDTLEFSNDCGKTVYLKGMGKLDNSLGWIVEMELAEQVVSGEEEESARIKIWYPGHNWTYDTITDFEDNAACPGHTLIDSGKIELI